MIRRDSGGEGWSPMTRRGRPPGLRRAQHTGPRSARVRPLADRAGGAGRGAARRAALGRGRGPCHGLSRVHPAPGRAAGGRPGAVGRPGAAPAGRGRRPAGRGAGRRGRPAGAAGSTQRRALAGDGADDVSGHVGWTRPTLGHFGDDLPRRSPAADAGAGAGRGGGGGRGRASGRTWSRRSAGLNEPPVVAAVSRQSLAAQAGALEQEPGPGPAPVLPGLAVRPAGDQRPDRRRWPAPPSTGPRRCWSSPGRARPPRSRW